MKSTPHPNSNQPVLRFPAFYKISTGYFGAETIRDQATEFLVFTLLGVATAWPIISMVVAVGRLLRNY